MSINPSSKVKDEQQSGYDQSYKLDRILRENPHLWKRMKELTNGQPSPMLIDQIYDNITKDRVMDKPVKEFKPNKKAGIQSGVKELLKIGYADVTIPDLEEPFGTIDIAGKTVQCDIEVIKVLRAVVKLGISYNEKLALQTRTFVIATIQLVKDGFISKAMLLEVAKGQLELAKEFYYLGQISEAVIEIFEEKGEDE